ncbi:MAG: hypothetical protein KC543_12130 [Myxococcales bacterium]|nr:hypothetical protein [Myxococcales bacterium]
MRPVVHTVEPRGELGAVIGELVSNALVDNRLPDLPVVARGTIDGTRVTLAQICFEIDLCGFYNESELGVARDILPAELKLGAFASTFSGTLSVPIVADGATMNATIEAPPEKFASLTPIERCPKPFCTTAPVSVSGRHISVGEPTFAGAITVEIDIATPAGASLGGADVNATVPGAAPFDAPLIDADRGIDLSDLTLPL